MQTKLKYNDQVCDMYILIQNDNLKSQKFKQINLAKGHIQILSLKLWEVLVTNIDHMTNMESNL